MKRRQPESKWTVVSPAEYLGWVMFYDIQDNFEELHVRSHWIIMGADDKESFSMPAEDRVVR